MKRILALVLTAVMLLCMAPATALAFDSFTIYAGQPGCQLTGITFEKALNPWLMWDVAFNKLCDGRVFETAKEHPNLIGQSVVPTLQAEGERITFNGDELISGETSVKLLEQNELVVYGSDTKAEYQIVINEINNGLPSVFIDTDNVPIPDKINYVDASISIVGGELGYVGDIYAAKAGIKLRGNSTMSYDKKPYRIKFDKKQNVFGLGKMKSWTLIANFLDPAYIRNEVSYNFATRLNQLTGSLREDGFVVFAPRMRSVEVYLNGEYVGLYDFCDHIQADANRVAIDEDEDADGNILGTLDTGYFMEVEDPSRVIPEYENEGAPYFTINARGDDGDLLYFQFKLPDPPTDEQIAYIQKYMQKISDMIHYKDPSLWEYVDMDSFVDWYLANELFKNTDSHMLSSCYFFKDKGGKLKMGPVWDFDLSGGAVSYSHLDDPTGWHTRDSQNADWFKRLFEMKEFSDKVNERWAALRDAGITDRIFSDMDERLPILEKAATRNYDLWFDNYVNAVNNTGWLTVPSYMLGADRWEQQIQFYRSFLLARINWFDEQLGYTPDGEAQDYVPLLSNKLFPQTTTIAINKSFNVRELCDMYLSVSCFSQFDIRFHFDIGSPALSSDWQAYDAEKYPFYGQTGASIAPGSYTNARLNLTEYLPYSKNPSATVITLQSITVTAYGSSPVIIDSLYAAAAPQENISFGGLGGTPTIWGTPENGCTLTADTMGVTPYQAAVSYQWNRNGTPIAGATAKTYKVTAQDIGAEITLTVTGSNVTGTLTTAPVTVQKQRYTYATSQVPELIEKTSDSITVLERTGYAYRIDGRDWQDTPVFDDLEPNTFYRVYYCHAETADRQNGQAGKPLYVITDPASVMAGDVDLDGELTTSDARYILVALAGRRTLTEKEEKIADLNNDNTVNTDDVRLLLQKVIDRY